MTPDPIPGQSSLRKIDTEANPSFYLRAGRNQLSRDKSADTREICTRLYCLGYGEGVNQLTIAEVNDGVPYLQSSQDYIDRYGLISRIWVDRRFEDAQSLKERGEVLLAGYQEPLETITVSAANLYPADGHHL